MVEELELVQSVNIQREIIGLAAIFLVGVFLEFVVLLFAIMRLPIPVSTLR